MNTSSRLFVPVLCLLTGMGISSLKAYAQDVPPPPAPPVIETPGAKDAPAPTFEPVDAKAIELINQSAEIYKNLKAYSDVVSEGDATSRVAWQKPNKVSIKTIFDKSAPQNDSTLVSDGKSIWLKLKDDPTHYFKIPFDKGQLNYYLNKNGVRSFISAVLPENPAVVLSILVSTDKSPRAPKVAKAKLTETTFENIPVDEVQVEIVANDPSLKMSASVTIDFGKEDHLIRKVHIEEGTDMKREEIHRDVKASDSLPASLFNYTPSDNVKLGDIKDLNKIKEDEQTYFDKRLKPGAKPFAFKAVDLNGKDVNLESYKGKVLMLDFWATWCGPCVGEIPNVLDVYKKYHAKGFEIVGISLDNDKTSLTDFLKEKKVPYRQVYNGKGWNDPIAHIYGVRAIPFMLIIGKNGVISAVNPRGEGLEPAVKKALSGK